MKRKAAPKRKKVKPIPEGYKRAFGAKEIMRMPGPEGKIGHAEIRIGDSRIMVADEHPQMDFLGPQSRGGTTVHLHVYVKDVDPIGHVWHLATHKEDLSAAELRKRAELLL